MEVYMLLNYYANIIYTLAVLIKVKDRGYTWLSRLPWTDLYLRLTIFTWKKKQNFTKTYKNMLNPIPYVQI